MRELKAQGPKLPDCQFSPKSEPKKSLMMGEEHYGSSSKAIDSSNVGFQLLKKAGWKEGTGLGVAEQGRLEPLETNVKKNKRGIGAEKLKKKPVKSEDFSSTEQNKQEPPGSKKKLKTVSKRLKKMQEAEKRMQEKEFERAFLREFWLTMCDYKFETLSL